ncbi:MAG: 7-cyano-7-deazaguanine synthase QueC [Phycisphaerae bacterium]|nr:7-cyano-7-deazaguanine synthase QueC [Tepidisphaeraceae bacterium]
MPPAVVLLSGGLDSTTALAVALSQGFSPHCLTFRYGQRHSVEIDAARRVAAHYGVKRHVVADIDLRAFGGSSLTSDLPVEKDRPISQMEVGVPLTYVPARNTIFLSFALAFAETTDAADIFIGVNALDFSGYPDCRPEYIRAYEAMANLATRAGVEGHRLTIHTPLISMTKAQIIRTAIELKAPLELTTTCYDPAPDGAACGHCDACLLRLKGFAEAGVTDPARYK